MFLEEFLFSFCILDIKYNLILGRNHFSYIAEIFVNICLYNISCVFDLYSSFFYKYFIKLLFLLYIQISAFPFSPPSPSLLPPIPHLPLLLFFSDNWRSLCLGISFCSKTACPIEARQGIVLRRKRPKSRQTCQR